ncbi:MAG: hypothetical protein ACRCTW_06070 [Lactococcus garvieae]
MSNLTKTKMVSFQSSTPRVHSIKKAILSYEDITRNQLRMKLENIFSGTDFDNSEIDEILDFANVVFNTSLCREEFYCFKSHGYSSVCVKRESNGISPATAFVAGCMTACLVDQMVHGLNPSSAILAGTFSAAAIIGSDVMDYRNRCTAEKVGAFAAGVLITGVTTMACHAAEAQQTDMYE